MQQGRDAESLSQSQILASRRALLHKRLTTYPLRQETRRQPKLPPLRKKSSSVTESISDLQSPPLTGHQTWSTPSKPPSVLQPDSEEGDDSEEEEEDDDDDEEEEEEDEEVDSSDSGPSSYSASIPPSKGMMANATASKKTTASTSDEWYSESEANWTNVDTNYKETTSQVLSSVTASTNNPQTAEKTPDDSASHPTISTASVPKEGLVDNDTLIRQEDGSAREHCQSISPNGAVQLDSPAELQK